MDEPQDPETFNVAEALEPLRRLTRDLRAAAKTLSHREARYLVDAYYAWQDSRIRSGHQVRQMDKAEDPEPHEVLSWLAGNASQVETSISSALGAYANSQLPGRWADSVCGIGPIISAGLLAHIDIRRAPTAGHIWRLAGLDPTVKWAGKEDSEAWIQQTRVILHKELDATLVAHAAKHWGRDPESLMKLATYDFKKQTTHKLTEDSLAKALARRPWNARLKRLCWLTGQCFMKVHNNEKDFYGKFYAERKALEETRNLAGEFKDQAAASLKAKNWRRDTDAKAAYLAGRLPKGRIELRAERYAVKLFLAHFHHISYFNHFHRHPPKPYAMSILKHGHEIKIPNWPFAEPQP